MCADVIVFTAVESTGGNEMSEAKLRAKNKQAYILTPQKRQIMSNDHIFTALAPLE